MAVSCVLITAKGNNESLPDKNLIPIAGKPSLQYVIEAAVNAKNIGKVFVSTEDDRIRELSEKFECTIIDRPVELAQPDSNHGDVIKHGVFEIEKNVGCLDNVTVLLGNTIMTSSALIDMSIEILNKKKDIDSVMSVWLAQDDHPYRALRIGEGGYLEAYSDVQSGTSRQFYPKVYYYDQGVWTFRKECVFKGEGPNPWWWMGKNSFPIIRNWVTGRDFHTQLDLDFSEYWEQSGQQDEILNADEIKQILQG